MHVNVDEKTKKNTTKKIIFIGDSLTKGRPGLSYVEILQQQLPQYTLINYGKNGDTVISLYQRLTKTQFDSDIDIAFLWIGTNDVLTYLAKPWSMIPKIVLHQPWARTQQEFTKYYQKILNMLSSQIRHIVTVSLLFIGEDLTNQWNKRLQELSDNIKTLSNTVSNIHFLDIRKKIVARYPSSANSTYLPSSWVLLFDNFLYKTPQDINIKSQERNLHFTLDGVHLNLTGTQYIVETFQQKIMQLSSKKTQA